MMPELPEYPTEPNLNAVWRVLKDILVELKRIRVAMEGPPGPPE